MVQAERKTRYHKSVRRVDNYMLLNKKEKEMNIREGDHKDSGTRTVLAVLSSSFYPLQFSPLPEMECGHQLSKHCQ